MHQQVLRQVEGKHSNSRQKSPRKITCCFSGKGKTADTTSNLQGYFNRQTLIFVAEKQEEFKSMQTTTLIIASLYGAIAVIAGAFGAHYLKKSFTPELLKSFETGVKYLMYHALALLFIGTGLESSPLLDWASWSFVLGSFLFSFSIFGLCIGAARGKKPKFLGPITPLGGLFLIIGWVLLLVYFV